MRKYSKRTKSTARKDYNDYIQMRVELENKGYELKSAMSKVQFENYYNSLREAKKNGEIKSQPWAELKKRERFVHSNRQVKVLANAASRLYDRKVTQQDIYKMSPSQITDIGAFINLTKQTGIYGGDYE